MGSKNTSKRHMDNTEKAAPVLMRQNVIFKTEGVLESKNQTEMEMELKFFAQVIDIQNTSCEKSVCSEENKNLSNFRKTFAQSTRFQKLLLSFKVIMSRRKQN